MKQQPAIPPKKLEAAIEQMRSESAEPKQITELRMIRNFYGMSVIQLSRALAPYVVLTPQSVWNILDKKSTTKKTLAALHIWLMEVGRKKFPLPEEAYND